MTPDLIDAALHPRWKPSPTILASIGLHCTAVAALVAAPHLWPWALGAVAANHGVLGALGLWPRSTLLGPNLTRLPAASAARREVAITFDDGPDPEVTPRVLDLLEAAGARASFFCIADAAARHPELCREIVRRGHTVENHSHGHQAGRFPFHGLGGFRREIVAAQRELAAATGSAPRFFRPPAGLRNPLLDPILHEQGLRLATWTRRGFDTVSADPALVASRLTRELAAGDILLLHDGHSARTRAGTPVVLDALPRVLEAVAGAGLKPVTLRQAIDS